MMASSDHTELGMTWLPDPIAGWVRSLVAFWSEDGEEDNTGLDYAFLQLAVGVTAALLPVMVVVFNRVHEHAWSVEDSISHFYYTAGRNYFVGSLCALAVFFLSYHHGSTGKYRVDKILSNFASAMALGVAFFPTTYADSTATHADKIVGTIHLTCATLLFVTLGVFAFFLFRRSSAAPSPRKRLRNRVYAICGGVIFVCIALVAVSELPQIPAGWPKLYWFEMVMVEAFAVSWLVKGGFLGILADKTARPGSPTATVTTSSET